MSYYERIKNQLNDPHRQRGMGSDVRLDARSMIQLIEDYERMSSKLRLEYNAVAAPHNAKRLLVDAVTANFKESPIDTVALISRVMADLSDEHLSNKVRAYIR